MSSGDASIKRASTGPSKGSPAVCTDCNTEFSFFKRKVTCSTCNDPLCTKCRSSAQYNLKCCKNCVLVSKPNLTTLAGSYTLCEELSLKELIKIATHFKIERPPFMEKPDLLILVWNRVIKLNAPGARNGATSGNSTSNTNRTTNNNGSSQPTQRTHRVPATQSTTQQQRANGNTQRQSSTRSTDNKDANDNPLAGLGQDISNAFKGAVSGLGDIFSSVDESINPNRQSSSTAQSNSRTSANARSSPASQPGTSTAQTQRPPSSANTNTRTNTSNTTTHPTTTTPSHTSTTASGRPPNANTSTSEKGASAPANADADKAKKTLYLLEDLHTEDQVRALNIRQLKYVLQKQHVTYAGVVERRELHDMVMRLVRQQAMDNLGLYSRSPTKRTRNKTEGSGSDGTSLNDTSATSMALDDEDEDKDMCKICYERPVNCVFLECGHLVTCVECGFHITECPICRQFITRRVHTFRA